MLYLEKPLDFKPDLEAVGCLVVFKEKILFLKRPDKDDYPNRWGLPSGKIDPGETAYQAMRRELKEETGIESKALVYLGKVYLVFPKINFPYHLYRYDADDDEPKIELSSEHVEFRFFYPEEIDFSTTVMDTKQCIEHFYER